MGMMWAGLQGQFAVIIIILESLQQLNQYKNNAQNRGTNNSMKFCCTQSSCAECDEGVYFKALQMYQKQDSQQQKQLHSPHFLNHIGRPKELIEKASLNKLYFEQWGYSANPTPLSCSPLLNPARQLGDVFKCSTQMQFKNLAKSIGKSRNIKFLKNGYRLCLKQFEESGQLGTLIYERVRQKADWNWVLKPAQKTKSAQVQHRFNTSQSVQFDSKFESGNLFRAYKYSEPNSKTYVLLTHTDTNTFGYNQWFYFRARSRNNFENVRFQIINMRKKYSSFEKGMKIAIFSEQKWREENIGWHRGGSNIEYSLNQIKPHQNSNQIFSTLGWDWGFQRQNEWIYFAYSYPYTYSELKQLVSKTKKYQSQGEWVVLCATALKNEIFLLKIEMKSQKMNSKMSSQQMIDESFGVNQALRENKTKQKIKFNRLVNKKRQLSFNQAKGNESIENFSMISSQLQKSPSKKWKGKKPGKIAEKEMQKQILIIMGRAHPSQTPSSFIAEGVINSLLKETWNQVKYLREKLDIYVIPMLNPDGVIHGNTRTSLTGNDLNRRWSHPHYLLHPQVYRIKQYFKDLKQKGKRVFAMVDLHGHTKKQSSFLYGCCDHKNYHKHAEVKLLNGLLGKADSNFNSLYSSHFVAESKKSTARVNFYREFKGCYSYTFQTSFLGCCDGSLHFSTLDYYNLGRNLLKSLAYFHAATRGRSKNSSLHTVNQSLLNNSLLKKAVLNHFEHFKAMEQSIKQQQHGQDKSQQQNGSSSAPSECNYNQDFLMQNLFPQTIKNQTRYRTQSLNKVGKRNMSVSVDEKSKQLAPEDKNKKTKELGSKTSLKDQRAQIYSKLPLINSQLKEEPEPTYQFHAFNFKSKKIGNKNINKRLGIFSEATID